MNISVLLFMCKFLLQWPNLLCNISIKAFSLLSLEFLLPILGHLLLLYIHMLILGHPMLRMGSNMVKLLTRAHKGLILVYCILDKWCHKLLLLIFVLNFKHLQLIRYTTRSHLLLQPNFNSLHGLKLLKVNKLHNITKIKGRDNMEGGIQK